MRRKTTLTDGFKRLVVFQPMSRIVAARSAEESIANVGDNDNQAPPQDNQVPLLEEVAMGDQVPVVPPAMEVEPRVPQHGSTMASHLRDFTRINPPMFFGLRSNEDPQDFLDKQVKESRLMRKNREAKRPKPYESESSKSSLDNQDKPRFKKRFSSHVPYKFTQARDDRVTNAKSKKLKGTISPSKKLTCEKCSKKHCGDWLIRTDNRYGCGKSFHEIRDCHYVKGQYIGSGKAKASSSNVDAPKKNRFYDFCSRGEMRILPIW
ncbi:hypothetical protein EJD97_003682 [Solanum chilense]|uniref:Uncharacterized protein n=1 Tax=Solanum chilense TaxID=4083 RepID=A0A6N2BYQ4_SOLCI|nr:hypothetical protein EJD97_003682 [Solanum chilense]